MDPPPCVREAVEEYKADNDWLAHFLEDCCEIGKDYRAPAGQLLSVYRGWSQTAYEFTRRQDEFKFALEERGFFRKRVTNGIFYFGLKLNKDYF